MGAPEPPYLYDAPPKRPVSFPYSQYDPKRATKESWEKATQSSRPTSTQSRPLIDFNRHPDSYLVVTGSDLKFKTMPSNTKQWVASMRWVQFSLRLLQLLGAGGGLFCAICLKPSDVVQAWIMRITPGYDLLITLYAVYHLIRSSTARTPGSSASYHFFALLMDATLIPFYAFIAVFTMTVVASTYNDPNSSLLWPSFFSSADVTVKLTFSFFCVACAMAGLHLISLGLDLYLIVIFKKILSLPPDMNPLEDNLTSRKSSKHKYKNSELSLPSTVKEKDAGFYSGSTLSGSAANINGSRISVMDKKEPEVRQIAFGHSRADSDMYFSPHNPTSARLSKQQYDQVLYQQLSARESAVSVGRPQSFMTANSRAGAISPEKKDYTNDNWYVLDEENVDIGMSPARDARTSPVREAPRREPRLPNIRVEKEIGFVHQPLAMNPPTPSIEAQQQRAKRNALEEVSINRSGTVTSDATITSSVYSESAPSLKSNKVRTPKSKYYGDLAAATRGVRGYAQLPQTENSPQRHEHVSPAQSRSPSPAKRQGRVVSRSGADIADETMTFIPEKSSRRRMVSGKIAEEGRAGGFWY